MMGDVMNPTPNSQMASNTQFQAKMPTYKNRNISETINPIKTKIEDQAKPNSYAS